MNPFEIVKNYISITLEKQGSSPQEFDKALGELNTGAGIKKVADGLGLFSAGKDLLTKGYFTGLAGVGGMGGLGLDNLDASVTEQNKKLKENQKNIDLLKRLTRKIKAEQPTQS